MIEYAALCTKKNGRLKIFDRAEFDRAFAQFGEGEELEISIKEVGRKRTPSQNKFFHGPILKAFMERCGYYKDEAKAELCLKFLPKELHRIDGTIVTVPGHTADLTVEEFNEFIDRCIQLAAELEVYIEDADVWLAKHRKVA